MVKRKDTKASTIQQIEDRAGALPTGVEGANVPSDFSIAPVAITDVDRAVFKLFDKTLRLQTKINQETIDVPAIFAGGERVFLVKRNSPPRDKVGAFILPIVSIKRTGIEQSKIGSIPGRGMGQNTGDIVIKKRLSSKDAKYQSLINKLNIQNQDNVASIENRAGTTNPVGSRLGRVATRRVQKSSFNTWTGEMMAPDLGRNIFEIITMPFPHFYTAMYEITFWTQYTQHMNQMLERFMTSYDAQGNQIRLDANNGYWFVAYVDDDVNSDDNFNDYTEDERFVKYRFNLRVPAYMHGAERNGSGIPVRSFLSAPQISFQLLGGGPPEPEAKTAPVGSGDINKFALSDINVLDKRGNQVLDTRQTTEKVNQFVADPFGDGSTGKNRLVRVITRNQRKGETVMSSRIFGVFDDINL